MGTVAVVVAVALGIVLIARETSSRRALGELRAELDAARADVRGQQQLANVGQLVSGLAQELKKTTSWTGPSPDFDFIWSCR
jgi:hypothetical protein